MKFTTAILLLFASPLLACVLQTELLAHDNTALTEASDITKVGDTYYVVLDEKFSLTKVSQDGSLEVVGITSGTNSDHEAIFRLPGDTNDADPTLVVCGEDTEECSPYVGGYKQATWTLVDGGDDCHADINFGNNKGVEGAIGLTNNLGDVYMLALIEGTGKIVTYRLTNNQWVSEGCTTVPETMSDYSGMALALLDGYQPKIVVTSQKSRALWVGEALGVKDNGNFEGNFRMGSGTRYNFNSNFEGVEGIFVENMDPSGSMTGVICSDDQGSGNFADSVHRFQLVCSTDPATSAAPGSTTVDPASTTVSSSTSTTAAASTTPSVVTRNEYFSTQDGVCPEENEFISSKAQCQEAAEALGLSDTVATRTDSEDHPYGCYYTSNRLWLNSDDEGEVNDSSDGGTLLNICVREVTVVLTKSPTVATTSSPSRFPTMEPTMATMEPTMATMEPTIVTVEPTIMTMEPTTVTMEPTTVTVEPTMATMEPTAVDSPSMAPTVATMEPTAFPTTGITTEPTFKTILPKPTTTQTPIDTTIDTTDPIIDDNSSLSHCILLAALITMLTV